METSATVTGKRGRPTADVVEFLNSATGAQAKRYRVVASRLALVAEKAVAKKHAKWRNPGLKSGADASQCSVVEGVDAAIPAWVAEDYERILG